MDISAKMPIVDGKMPHLMIREGDIAPIVLLPGNPARIELIRELCDDFEIISNNREYVVGTGTYKGIPVSVVSTGIGSASTEIAVLELIQLGAKALIRIGGTGVIDEKINCGDMVITTASMRRGGSSSFYAPPEYPAVASIEVVNALIDSCENRNAIYHKGIGASIGSYYAGQGREIAGKTFNDKNIIEEYQKLNVINLEMEAETIITLSNVFGVLSGAICAVHGNRITDEWLHEFLPAQREMCIIALESILTLSKLL